MEGTAARFGRDWVSGLTMPRWQESAGIQPNERTGATNMPQSR